MENHSYASIDYTEKTPYSHTATFGFEDNGELERLRTITTDGMEVFEQEYGIRSVSCTSPASEFSPILEPALAKTGVKVLNRSLIQK